MGIEWNSQKYFDHICQVVNDIRSIFEEKYDYSVDHSLARMTPEDVMEIVIPIAKEEKGIGEDGKLVFKLDEPFLIKCLKNEELIWLVSVSFYIKGQEEDFVNADSFLYTIEVDDETGEASRFFGKHERRD